MRTRKSAREKYLEPEEFKSLLEAAKGSEFYFLFYLLGNLGLRVSEGIRLRVEDIKEKDCYVHCPTLKQDKVKGIVKGCIKRGDLPKAYVDLGVPEAVMQKIQDYITDNKLKEGWLFPEIDGLHITDTKAKKAFKRYCKKAGLNPRYSIHALRHFKGVLSYKTHKDIRAVQTLLRHKNINSTVVYTTMDLETKRELAEKVEVVE